MLPREKRLSKSKDIRNILRCGKKLTMDGISLYIARGRGRIGFITTKGFKNAVSRNRAKRRVRGAFEAEYFSINNCDLLFVIKPEILEADFEKIRDIIRKLTLSIRDEEDGFGSNKVL